MMYNSTDIELDIETVVQDGGLSCSNCRNYLSVGPVLSNSIFGNICGREECALLASSDGVNSEQVLYETVVQLSLFPCKYRNAGCSSVVKWGEVEEHEKACEYKNMACPFLGDGKKCDWTGDPSEFLLHAENSHPDREFKNSNIIAEVWKLENKRFFLNIVQNIVLIVLHLDDIRNILYCYMWASDRIRKRLTYQIKFIDRTTLESISTCSKQVGVLHPKNSEGSFKIDLNTIRNLLEDVFFFDVNFRLDNNEIEMKKSVLPELIPESSKHFISFSATNSENRAVVNRYGRNTNRKLSLLYDRPCRNFSRGCNYLGSVFSMITHRQNCTYAKKSCFFCNVFVENLLAHGEKCHNIIKNRTSNTIQLTPSTKFQCILPYDGHHFFLNFEINNARDLTYEVNCAGMKEVRYVYELHFMSDEAQFSAITLKNICHPGDISFEKHQISEDLSKQTEIPCVLLENVFPELKNLIFRLTISKLKASDLDIPATHSVLQVNNVDLSCRRRKFDRASRAS
ncbi:hypothetical protein WA026_022610 [Henosepilachna vigintioctopunctata]|uniref:RING-type E3 ubiquitin transferase n=1 Tax=Henosepilachna vigintioctopunctata TaxID=420089 RepID=A0AAW1V3T8_9CUCU